MRYPIFNQEWSTHTVCCVTLPVSPIKIWPSMCTYDLWVEIRDRGRRGGTAGFNPIKPQTRSDLLRDIRRDGISSRGQGTPCACLSPVPLRSTMHPCMFSTSEWHTCTGSQVIEEKWKSWRGSSFRWPPVSYVTHTRCAKKLRQDCQHLFLE